jgi:hypothetical protein
MTVRAEYLYEGHRVVALDKRRVPHANRAWGYYNAVEIRYVDPGFAPDGPRLLPAGKFFKAAKATGRKLFWQGGAVGFCVEGTGLPAWPVAEEPDPGPYVCPGCHAVSARCEPGCVDAALQERLDAERHADSWREVCGEDSP